MSGLLVIGAGGHGLVVAEVAQALGRWDAVAFLDDDPSVGSHSLPGPLLGAVVLTLGYALLLELLQLLVPGRFWEPKDLLADIVGVLLPLPIISRIG